MIATRRKLSFAAGTSLLVHFTVAILLLSAPRLLQLPEGSGIGLELGDGLATATTAPSPAPMPPEPVDAQAEGEAPAPTSIPSPAPAPSALRGGGGGGGPSSYFGRVRAHLDAHKSIDFEADGTNARGVAEVRFLVRPDGGVEDLRLGRGSGDARLDAEALALVQRAAPLPRPPRDQALRLSVPIEFR